MRCLLSIALIFVASVCQAQEAAVAKARAAAALTLARMRDPAKPPGCCSPGCNCGGTCKIDCTCEARARAAKSLAAIKHVLTYAEACDLAMKTKIPGIVFVGMPLRPVTVGTRVVTVSTPSLTGFKAPCVVVMLPGDRAMMWHRTLPANASEEDIRRAIPSPQVIDPDPFSQAYQRVSLARFATPSASC